MVGAVGVSGGASLGASLGASVGNTRGFEAKDLISYLNLTFIGKLVWIKSPEIPLSIYLHRNF